MCLCSLFVVCCVIGLVCGLVLLCTCVLCVFCCYVFGLVCD